MVFEFLGARSAMEIGAGQGIWKAGWAGGTDGAINVGGRQICGGWAAGSVLE